MTVIINSLKGLIANDCEKNNYYSHERHDVIDMTTRYCKSNHKEINSVLEIGCGDGKTGELLKQKLGIKWYVGIELMEAPSSKAKRRLDKVINGNVEDMILQNSWNEDNNRYDAIVLLDVLEHLYNPWIVLDAIGKLLNPDGILVASVPNAGHIHVLNKLLRDKFEYEQEGLLDRTHIRFFTYHTIKKC